ncbi:hypothetical protein BDV25DRAFT_136938 [Aspergillus avenaceus]|uniref:Polyketide synthase n=1 Tax=Aspergillus avenaceus TaxID=36643 RepID=A0A5N6U445_ASPAV|nr:hypothetical protein BDV25DRAFT_136938 [Aspergillus avenaceus]
MSSRLKPPAGGKHVLVFGCQCLSFNIEDFRHLRAIVLDSPEHAWMLDTLSELPVYYRTAATRFLPKLCKVQGIAQLRSLCDWFRTGDITEESFPLPYVQLAPLLMIIHFTQYWQYRHLSQTQIGVEGRSSLISNLAVEAVGFCIGVLSAAVVSAAGDDEQMRQYGAVALRLSTLLGALGDVQEKEEQYTSLAAVWKEAELGDDLPRLIAKFPGSYITVRFDSNRATVMTPRRYVGQLQESLQAAGFSATQVNFNGRYHWAGHENTLQSLLEMCDADPSLQLPDTSQLVLPMRTNITGSDCPTGSLHSLVLRSILTEQCQWLDIFSAAYRDHMEGTQSVIVEFGPERCVPPTLLRNIRERVVHFADLDLDFISRISPLRPTPRIYDDDIAVVGMACRVAGADDLEEFWQLLCAGKSQHREMPPERYENYETPWRPNAIRPWFGNFVRDIDAFDHKFFKKVPREAMSQDPQQRLLLQVAYQALEQSGYFHRRNINKNIGCYVASCTVDYEHNVNCYPATAYSATGLLRSFMAGKLSHYFGWRGPAFCIDSACSGAAVALHQACQSILRGECTAALVGGANAITSPLAYDNLAGASFVSPTGPCKPFDAKADGYCRGEGFAAVFIKRLSDAISEGDSIIGTIAATAVEQNNNCTPIVVPDAASLGELFTKVTRQAHLRPQDISVVEAHGTGTQAGDPAEYASIKATLGGPHRLAPLALGSVKGLVGHTEGVSGLIALVKVLLMINEGKLPPQPNFESLNPYISASSEDQIEISTSLRTWETKFRAALINNYGASGSNASMVITQSPTVAQAQEYPIHETGLSLPFRMCAFDESRLREWAGRFLRFLRSQAISARHATSLANLSYNICRQSNPKLESQISFSCRSLAELESTVLSISDGDKSKVNNAKQSTRPVVLCFGGQVSTFVGLDRTVYDSVLLLRQQLDECDSLLRTMGHEGLYPGIFQRTPVTDHVQLQTQLFALQYSCARCWMQSGVEISAVIGHSFGELTALCISGSLSLPEAIELVARRATLIRDSWGPDPGSMIALEGDKQRIEHLLDEACKIGSDDIGLATIACINGPTSFTVAGRTAAIDSVHAMAQRSAFSDIKAKRLQVTNAFHSVLVQPLITALSKLTDGLHLKQPTIHLERATEVASTGAPPSTIIAEHLRQPVYFYHAVQRLVNKFDTCVWLEAGSNSTITTMIARILGSSQGQALQPLNITNDNGLHNLTAATLNLWRERVSVAFWGHHRCQTWQYQHVFLPPYQFEKTKHWMDNKKLPFAETTVTEAAILAFAGYQDKENKIAKFTINTAHPLFQEAISGHIVSRAAPVAPASFMLDYVVEALRSLPEGKGKVPYVQDVTSDAPLCLDPSRKVWVELHLQDTERRIWNLQYMSEQSDKGSRSKVLHCAARFVLYSADDPEMASEFARYSRLVTYRQCRDILDDPNVDDILQGRNVYQTFAEIVDYSQSYRGVRKLVGKGNHSAGRIVMAYSGKTWADTFLCDSFSQVGGFWVNCMTDRSPSDIYLANGMERWMRSPLYADPAVKRPETWEVLAKHQAGNDCYTSDIFVFDPTTGELVEMLLGMRYARVKKTTFSKILSKFAPSCVPILQDTNSNAARSVPTETSLKAIATEAKTNKKPRSNLGARVKEIVAEFCAMDPGEIHDEGNMADAGVDSLMAMELAREIEEAFQCTLSATDLMEADTFQDLVNCVKLAVGERDDEDSTSISGSSSDADVPEMDNDTSMSESLTSAGSDILDLNLPRQTVLEAFGETKALTDEFLANNQCSGRVHIFAPLQIQLCVTLTLEAFEKLESFIRPAPAGERLKRISFDPQHAELVDYLYNRLEEARIVDLDGTSVIRTSIKAPDRTSSLILEEIEKTFPEYAGASRLAYFTGSKLASVLRGEQDGLQLIFGTREGQELVSWMYGDEPHNVVGYKQMIDFIQRLVGKLSPTKGSLRILEMGAGTGGGTKWFLPVLAKLNVSVQYTFTDISPAFLAQARRRFKAYPFMQYRIHDIEKPPAEDLLGTQHIIIASNAVHATANLQESTRNMRKALRPDGVLMMLEMTRPAFAIDIVFGLFRGWWVFNDGRNHAITNEERWEKDMHEVGYGHVDWTDGQSPEVSVQRVIFATASGVQSERSTRKHKYPTASVDNATRRQTINDYIERSVEGYCPPITSKLSCNPDGHVVLVTGASGSLGSHVVAQLTRQQTVKSVVCVNRRTDQEPLRRQTLAFEKRGICLGADQMAKLMVFEADTSESDLGLSSGQYDYLKSTVTHILHNAWPMNGASELPRFERQFRVMRNLIGLARDIAGARPANSKVGFQFISSIGTVGQYPLVTADRVVPENKTDIEYVLPNGYGEAKFVCERIVENTLQHHPDRFNATIVRPGQIAGSSDSGHWNTAEHVPLMIKSAQTLKLLPDLQGSLSWTPVDVVAASVIEILLADNPLSPFYHVDNPNRQRWQDMAPILADELGIPVSNVVPFQEWIQRVKAFSGSREDNPASVMADWLEKNFERMSCGGLLLDTTRAREQSSTLAHVKSVNEGTVRRYLQAWKRCGFLH